MNRIRGITRLFVAAYPPMESREAVRSSIDLYQLAHHALVHPEQLHLTLQFIGQTPAGRLDSVLESVRRSASGISGFDLTPRRICTLPTIGSPRVVAVLTDSPAPMIELQRRLAHRFARGGVGGKLADGSQDSHFVPHITVARFDHGISATRIDEPHLLPAFPIRSIHVMKSELRPGGAKHTVVEEIQLQ